MLESCVGCKFWERTDEGDRGVCRRYPPVFIAHSINPTASTKSSQQGIKIIDHSIEYPETLEEDWCGEFSAGKTVKIETKSG